MGLRFLCYLYYDIRRKCHFVDSAYIVHDFLDAFRTDLLSLLSERHIEFIIDLELEI